MQDSVAETGEVTHAGLPGILMEDILAVLIDDPVEGGGFHPHQLAAGCGDGNCRSFRGAATLGVNTYAFDKNKRAASKARSSEEESTLTDRQQRRLHSSFIACHKQSAHCSNIATGHRLAAVAASIQLFNNRAKLAARFRAAPV